MEEINFFVKWIGLVSPFITIIFGFVATIYKLQVKKLEGKIIQERELREQFEKTVASLNSMMVQNLAGSIESLQHLLDEANNDWEKEADELKENFKEGLETERTFRMDIMKRHDEMIKELFDTKVNKDVCAIHHKK